MTFNLRQRSRGTGHAALPPRAWIFAAALAGLASGVFADQGAKGAALQHPQPVAPDPAFSKPATENLASPEMLRAFLTELRQTRRPQSFCFVQQVFPPSMPTPRDLPWCGWSGSPDRVSTDCGCVHHSHPAHRALHRTLTPQAGEWGWRTESRSTSRPMWWRMRRRSAPAPTSSLGPGWTAFGTNAGSSAPSCVCPHFGHRIPETRHGEHSTLPCRLIGAPANTLHKKNRCVSAPALSR